MSDAVEIRRLSQRDRCGDFTSGNSELDQFLRRFAQKNQARGWSSTWVAVHGGRIAGYVTVAAGSLTAANLRAVVPGLPGYPVPILRLARMATLEGMQGQGIGRRLLVAVCQAALSMAETAGCTGVYVDAKPGAVGFYRKHDFVVLETAGSEDGTTPMFLAMATVRRAMASEPSAPDTGLIA